jgi:hypothetical protein
MAMAAVDLAHGYSFGPGRPASLQHVERLLGEANGAGRQRRAYAAGGIPAVLRGLVANTQGSGVAEVAA